MDNLSKEQELLQYLETTAPVQVLRDINNGKEPIPASIQLAEDLVMKYGMPVGVVNVLLEYVMLSTDMKLPKAYVEKIADHRVLAIDRGEKEKFLKVSQLYKFLKFTGIRSFMRFCFFTEKNLQGFQNYSLEIFC